GEHDGKIMLRRRISQFCSELVPSKSPRKILRHALSGTVQHAALKLRRCMILPRGLLDPASGRRQISWYATSIEVQHTEGILGFCFSGLSRLGVPINSLASIGSCGVNWIFARVEVTQLQCGAIMASLRSLLQQAFTL